MTTRIKLRRDTAANWISANPILSAGEPGLETDTRKIKYGDGATAWRDLPYANSKIEGRTPIEIHTQDPNSWVNVVGRPRNAAAVTAVAYDTSGNVIALSNNYNGTAQSGNDEFATLTKFDPEGNVLWQTDIFGNYPDGFGLDTDSNDNIYFSLTKNNGPYAYVGITKVNSDGEEQWSEGFGHFYDCAAFLVVDRNDNPVINGYSSDPGSDGGYVLRLDKATGDVLENVRITDDTNGNEITNQGMAIDSDNNVILVGSHYNGDNSVLIVQKLSGIDFTNIWAKKIETIDQYNMYGGGVACDGANNIYITGSFTGNATGGYTYKAVVLKLDDMGVVQWSRDIKGECNNGGTAIVVGPNDGNLYLTSVSYTPVYNDQNQWYSSKQVVALACYESNTGKVLWQNYISQNQLSEMSPGDNVDSNFDYDRGQVIDMQGDRIVVGGVFVPHANNGYGGSDWGMPTGWVMQFPSNGDNVDIGGWKLKTSRIPGRFQSFQTTDHNIAYDFNAFEWGSEFTYVPGDSNISVVRITQDSNTWTFDLKGDLNLPADGDLTLAKNNVGWLNLQGFKYNNQDDVYFQGVCVDPDDNSYAYGYDHNYGKPYVVKYSPTGEIMWQMYIDNEYNGNVYGCAEAAAWDRSNNQLVVASTNWANTNFTLVTALDPQTGKVLTNTTLDMGQNGMNVYDIQITSGGIPVVVGQTYGGFKGYTVTVNAGTSGLDYLDVLASDFTDGNLPTLSDGNWLISGTGIDGLQYVSVNTNRYDPVTATVAVGSGAQFEVGVTSGVYSVSITSGQGGTGYKVGDQLLILGSNLGGNNTDNNLTLNVDSVDGDIITAVSIVGSPTAGGSDALYSAQTALPVPGTGATFYVDKSLDGSTPVYSTGYNVGGFGYKQNDVLTIPGTSLGGVSPDNDISLTVTGVDIFGAITNYSINGTPTPDMSTIRLHPNLPDDVDFSQEGTWQVGYYNGTDGFVWTPGWQKLYGLPNNISADGEYFTSVALDPNDNIIVGMEAYDSNFFGGYAPISIVIKLDGDNGNIIWSRCLDNEGAPMSSPLVGADSEGNIVVAVEDWGYSRMIYKFDTDGNALWKVATDVEEVFYKYSGTIAFDADDNIIVTGQDDYDDWAIDKLDTNGNVLFNRRLKLGYDMYQQEGDDGTRWTAVQGNHIWTAGTTYAFANNYYNGFVAKLPLDGTGITGSTVFDYTDEQIPYEKWNEPGIYGDFSGSFEVHASSGITATESTPSVNTIVTWPEDYFKTYTFPITEPTAGGIVFADGSRQDTSASDLPQRLVSGYNSNWQASYKLQLTDRGRHLLLTDNREVWLGDYNQVQFPVGSVITLINTSGGYRRVYFNSSNNWMGVSGTDTTSYGSYTIYLEIPPHDGGNVVTLIKIGGEPQESDNNAPPGYVYSRWIASGAGLNITD
jgi:hypothetical protein